MSARPFVLVALFILVALFAATTAQGPAQAQSTVTLTVSKIAETTATLTIDGHNAAWYYKADAGPDNTCQGPVTAGTKTNNLTGLTGQTTYTYTAYSDATCTTANELAAASPFTTGPWLHVSDVSDATAKLFISGRVGNWYYKADAAPHTDCQGPVADTTIQALTGLTAGAAYTYTAYSDSGCATQLAAARPFTTPAFPLDQCHDLALELSFYDDNGNMRSVYKVSNRTDETITDVRVEIKFEGPHEDGPLNLTPPVIEYTDDGVVMQNREYRVNHHDNRNGRLWFDKADPHDGRTWAARWEMPAILPAASHSIHGVITRAIGNQSIRNLRHSVVMAQFAADGTTALCQTRRVYWTQSFGPPNIKILEPSYGVTLSADKRYPTAGDTVNFKVTVNVRDGYGVNARVGHTPGLTLNTASVTAPAKTTWDYTATKRQGDFFIGTESTRILSTAPTPTYEITLPFQVQTGATVSEQCVTVTVTGVPGAGPRAFNQAGDDPSDNTATACLAPLPLFQEDGDELALWTVYPCVSNTTSNTRSATEFPCDSTDSLEVASVDNATGTILSAAPNQVNTFIKLDPVAAAVVDTHFSNVHLLVDQGGNWNYNTEKVSWQTKRSCPIIYDHHNHPIGEDCSSANHHSVPGVKVGWSHEPFNNQYVDWGHYGRIASISGVGPGLDRLPAQYGATCATTNTTAVPSGLDDLPDAPGGMMIRNPDGSHWQFRVNNKEDLLSPDFPRFKLPMDYYGNVYYRLNMSTQSNTTEMNQVLAEFGALGTYVVDYHGSMVRIASTPDATYCDTLRTVFHVGPMAELGVWDGGVNQDLPSNQVAYTLNLDNAGPDPSEAGQVLVELPADATSVRTIPPGYGTFHAAGAVAGVSHGPYWLWDIGELDTPETERTYRRPQGREVTLVVGGASAGDKATATVSNGNGHCKVGTITLPHVIRTEDCAAINADTSNSVTTAEWMLDNPYTLCLNYDSSRDDEVIEVLPKPANETACTATSGNSWHAGTVLDHHQGNNVAELTARAGGADASSAGAKTVTTPFTYVTLSWPAATDAAEYRVFRSTTGAVGSYQRIAKIAATAEPTYTDETVLADATYYYHVDALYPSQKLAEIHTMSITATREPLKSKEAPGTVSKLAAARKTGELTTINVTWMQPTIDATAATRYDVLYRSRPSGGSWTDWNEGAKEQTALAYTHENAGGATTYQFRVRGVNLVDGDSHPGHWSTATVQPLKNPEQVQGLTATRNFNKETEINVSWGKPAAGTDPTGYDVEYQVNGTGDWVSGATRQTARTYKLETAVGASSYRFRVRTVTESGGDWLEGNWAYSGTVPKVTIPHQVGNLRAERQANDTIINLTWTPPSNARGNTTYNVQYKENNASAWTPHTSGTKSFDGITHKYVFTHSGGGNSSYVFQVQAVTPSGGKDLMGSWRTSNTVRKMTAPNQVGTVTATPNGETSITVTWSAPSSGTTPSGYYVRHSVNGAPWSEDTNDWIKIVGTTTTHTHTLTGSDADNGYQFQVRAYALLTGSGTELLGNWRNSNTLRGQPPGDIASVTASRTKDGDDTTIDVDWDPSSRVVTYEVQYRTNSGSWRSATTTGKDDAREWKQTNAGGVETYQFRVRGVNSNGNGAWTDSAVVQPPPVGYHGAEVGVDWITLKVTSGPWWFDYRDHKGDWSSCRRVASGSYTLTNLRATTTYLFDLYTSAGCSADQIVNKESLRTLSDVYDWGKCWNTDDCRNIDSPNDMSRHTHKRSRLAEFGVTISGCDWSTRETHTHGWPDGGYGAHWHCKIY